MSVANRMLIGLIREPEEALPIAGKIIKVSPLAIEPGEPITVRVSVNYLHLAADIVGAWHLNVMVEWDGYWGEVGVFTARRGLQKIRAHISHFGRKGELHPRIVAMPNRTISGYVTLLGREKESPLPQWYILDREEITIHPKGLPEEPPAVRPTPGAPFWEAPPPWEPPPPEPEPPRVPAAWIVVGLVVVVAVVALLVWRK